MAGAAPESPEKCTCVIVLGMAGSGKSTFVKRMTTHLMDKHEAPYVINLDPAVLDVSYPTNIDIRDTVNYKEVMRQNNLGPNGGIMTSLNLFATKFDQVMSFIEKKREKHKYVLIDTPGQIEVFTWSASGAIITQALASTYPTVIVYVVDTPRCSSPVTFMSNMLYACSILYKAKLPFIVAMNKTDIMESSFAIEWMRDFEAFLDALQHETPSLSGSLAQSMCLALEEFYANLRATSVSSVTGEGLEDFFKAVDEGSIEYEKDYKQWYQEMERKKQEKESQTPEDLMADSEVNLGVAVETPRDLMHSKHRPSPMVLAPHGGTESDDEDEPGQMDADDENELKEYESFKRFLQTQKAESTQSANQKTESTSSANQGAGEQST